MEKSNHADSISTEETNGNAFQRRVTLIDATIIIIQRGAAILHEPYRDAICTFSVSKQ